MFYKYKCWSICICHETQTSEIYSSANYACGVLIFKYNFSFYSQKRAKLNIKEECFIVTLSERFGARNCGYIKLHAFP